MIDSTIIEAGEARLTYRSGLEAPALAAQFSRAQVDREATDRFLSKQMGTLKKHAPDLDPRFEASVVTMMLHCFLTGVMACRMEGVT